MKKLFLATILAMSTTQLFSADTITFGIVGLKPDKEIKSYDPLVNYLDKSASIKAKVVVVPTIEKMVEKVKAKEVDVLIHSPFIAAKVARDAGSKMVLRQWKKEVGEYTGCLFAKKGTIKDVTDLKGKMVSLEDKESASGAYLPVYILKKAGLKVTEKKNPTDAVAADEVGIVYSDDYDNTLMWVKKDRVAAGGTATNNVKDEADMQVIAESPMIPRSIVSYGPHVEAALGDKVTAALLGMSGSEDGKKALKEFSKTTKFDKLPKSSDEIKKNILDLLSKIEG